MTCEDCLELMSAFLDNDLDRSVSANVQTHLASCAECAKICEDFAVILDFCHEEPLSQVLPPNSQALWCRINNIIETEVGPEAVPQNKPPQAPPSWSSRVWQLSFSQVASTVLGVALISSLVTFVGIKNYFSASAPNDLAADTATAPNFVEKVLGGVGIIETLQQKRERRLIEQRAAIEYWNKRVEVRRQQWDQHLREAFDRNLNEIDQAVSEYTLILQENPQDELSGEMLDSTLNEKMDLLREFSEL